MFRQVFVQKRAQLARTFAGGAAGAVRQSAANEVTLPPFPADSPIAPFEDGVEDADVVSLDHSLAHIVPPTKVIESLVGEHGAPLLILSPTTACAQYDALQAALPRAKLHYAIKSLPHTGLVERLAAHGAFFDLATTGEVRMMEQLGVDPSRTIHTHPVKRPKDIEAALEYGCTTFVVDNKAEIDKLAPFGDDVQALLRLSFRSMDATIDLSYKFGAQPHEAMDMLLGLDSAGVRPRGLCFHTGSNAALPTKTIEAIRVCRQVFDNAADAGISLQTLDIGGGFPVPAAGAVLPIDTYCEPIADLLDELFPDTEIIAEPGRFISSPSMTSIVSVMGKSERYGTRWYFVDDGLYGSFSNQVFDKASPVLVPLKALAAAERGESTLQGYLVGSDLDPSHTLSSFPSVLAGPTCDSFDIIRDGVLLPSLDVGDLLVAPMMGAYTWANATDFNFFYKTKVVIWDP